MTETTGTPGDLGWLLEKFIQKAPKTNGALLVSKDGLKLVRAGLTADEADRLAAIVSGQYSLARGVGTIKPHKATPKGPSTRQILVEGDPLSLFVMSAGAGLPAGAPLPSQTGPGTVGTLLGVLVEPEADLRVLGHQMSALVRSVGEHLVIPTRSE